MSDAVAVPANDTPRHYLDGPPPKEFLVWAYGEFPVGSGVRVVFTRAYAEELLAAGPQPQETGLAEALGRPALWSIRSGVPSAPLLGACWLEARGDGVYAVDVDWWLTTRREVVAHGLWPSLWIVMIGKPPRILGVGLTNTPFDGTTRPLARIPTAPGRVPVGVPRCKDADEAYARGAVLRGTCTNALCQHCYRIVGGHNTNEQPQLPITVNDHPEAP
jgi:hypothetical protein